MPAWLAGAARVRGDTSRGIKNSTRGDRPLLRLRTHRRTGSVRFAPTIASSLQREEPQVVADQIVPFFEEHPLITAKAHDFDRFAQVLSLMRSGYHLTHIGLGEIAAITQQMNRKQQSRSWNPQRPY